MTHLCYECGEERPLCGDCHRCAEHCDGEHPAHHARFDADELGLDPETDNNPGDPSRHA